MGSFLQSRRYGNMSSGGEERRLVFYELHKVQTHTTGPKTDGNKWEHPTAAATAGVVQHPPPDVDPIRNIIDRVKEIQIQLAFGHSSPPPPNLQQSNGKTIHVHTALLLIMYMSPGPAPTNTLDRLSTWKANFKGDNVNQLMNQKDLGEALKNMGFEVSGSVLRSLMSLFQTSGGNQPLIDYNNFIQCCAIVEMHLPKTVKIEGPAASMKAQPPAATQGSSSGPSMAPKTSNEKEGGKAPKTSNEKGGGKA